MSDEIAPFTLTIDQGALDDLNRRLDSARWPERETVDDWTQGAPLAKVRALCDHWRSGYDWRRCEARLNQLGQFKTTIDGLGIHFLHVRSPHPNAMPLIVTHGWPGSVMEFMKVIGPLTNPTAHGGSARTRSTSSPRRCPATGSPTSRPEPAGACRGSPPPGSR